MRKISTLLVVRILFVLKTFPAGSGVDTVTRILADKFVKLEFEVSVCYFLEIGTAAINDKIERFKFPCKWETSDCKENVIFFMRIIENQKIDIIINQEGDVVSICNLCNAARKNTAAKLVSCLHFSLFMNMESKGSFFAKFLPKNFIKKRRMRIQMKRRNFVYDNSDSFVLLSDRLVELYKNIEPNKKFERLKSIANPIVFSDNCEDVVRKKDKNIIYVGRIAEKQKRISLLIEFWRKFIVDYPDWNFEIIGDGEDIEELKKKAELIPKITFMGYKEPSKYYSKASILVMTSAFEGFPMVLVEAQKYGCIPVVMDTFESLQDIIEDGRNGLISKNNLDDFISKICYLIDNDKIYQEISKNAMRDCRKFDVNKIIMEWECLFKELLEMKL